MSPYGPYRHWLCPSRGKEAANKNERPVASAGSVAGDRDILTRLRDWRSVHLARLHELMSEAADEIERLRLAIRRLAEQDATLSVCNGNVTVTMDGTLTDAERRAVEAACNFYSHECETDKATDDDYQNAATLRGLLERLR